MARPTIASIQYLRAAAAMMVVLWHTQLMVPTLPPTIPYFFGNAGVLLFFAISGFLMVRITGGPERSPAVFLRARAVRVLPLYWLFTAGSITLMVVAPALFRGNELTLRHVALSILLIPHTIPADPLSFQPIVKVGWTLIYEAFFYLLFATAMLLWFARRVLVTSLVLVALTVAYVVVRPSIDRAFPLFVFGDAICLQFVVGMATARLLDRFPLARVPAWAAAAMAVVAAAAMTVADRFHTLDVVIRFVYYGVPSGLVLTMFLLAERTTALRSAILHRIGDASYSIYLVHMLPLAVMRWAWLRLGLPVTGLAWSVVFVAIASSLAVGCGLLSYAIAERPIAGFFRRRRDRPA